MIDVEKMIDGVGIVIILLVASFLGYLGYLYYENGKEQLKCKENITCYQTKGPMSINPETGEIKGLLIDGKKTQIVNRNLTPNHYSSLDNNPNHWQGVDCTQVTVQEKTINICTELSQVK